MLLLGHLGITLGVAYALAHRLGPARATKVDYRVVLLGGILSDLIDKPVALAFGIAGRAAAHTLLFASLLTLVLALPLVAPRTLPRRVAQRLGNPAIYLALGVWVHLALDRMWENPRVLLWPQWGWDFPPGGFDPFTLLTNLLHDPYTLGGEAVGLAILVAVALRHGILRRGGLAAFIRSGRLE